MLHAPRARAEGSASTARPNGRVKSVVVLFLLGGPSQFETWDPKPDAPAEIRGDHQPIATSVPGLFIGEGLARTARWMHDMTLLRAMHTGDSAHSTSGYAMMTGVPHRPLQVEGAQPGAPNDWPFVGSVVRRFFGNQHGMPSAMVLPETSHNDDGKVWPGQQGGFLGQVCDPWTIEGDPSAADFAVQNLTLPSGLNRARWLQRRGLRDSLDQRYSQLHPTSEFVGWDAWRHQAESLLESPHVERAFRIDQESPADRERYGRTRFGQSVLMARRLVETGIPFVQVNWTRLPGAPNGGHWDTHSQNSVTMKDWLLPAIDQPLDALLSDLRDRGRLDDTVVAVVGEFGRSPKINGVGGRDHWGNVFSIALAGGPFRRGMAYGESDRLGAAPKAGLVTPADYTATLFHTLGLSPDAVITDMLGRTFPISSGRVLHEVLS